MWALAKGILAGLTRTAPLFAFLGLAGACVALLFTVNSGKYQLVQEQTAHQITRQERDEAIRQWHTWQTLADHRAASIAALRDANQLCLEREQQAQLDAQARNTILSQAQTRPRTAEEQQEVVDDKTRQNAVSRLNRPL